MSGRCDVCESPQGVSIVTEILDECESAGVRRLCAACNVKGASRLRRLGVQGPDRKREFAKYLKAEKAKNKECAK